MLGFPIRKSLDQSLHSSPKHINVSQRPSSMASAQRHLPCALNNLIYVSISQETQRVLECSFGTLAIIFMNSSLFKTLYSSVLLGKIYILLTYLVFNVQIMVGPSGL